MRRKKEVNKNKVLVEFVKGNNKGFKKLLPISVANDQIERGNAKKVGNTVKKEEKTVLETKENKQINKRQTK